MSVALCVTVVYCLCFLPLIVNASSHKYSIMGVLVLVRSHKRSHVIGPSVALYTSELEITVRHWSFSKYVAQMAELSCICANIYVQT